MYDSIRRAKITANTMISGSNKKMKLDFLVLKNTVAYMKPLERILLRGVERNFANILQAANDQELVSLKISGNLAISLRGKSIMETMRSRDVVPVQESSLEEALSCIFLHFKSFRSVDINGLNSDLICRCLLDSLLIDACRPTFLRRLKLEISFNSKYSWRLIRAFSHLITAISIKSDFANPSILWKSVAQCSELTKLSFYQNYSDSCYLDDEDIQLMGCVQRLKLTHFKSNAKFIDSDWVIKAFNRNKSLQALFIQEKLLPELVSTPIATRLRSLRVNFDRSRSPQSNEKDIRDILGTLPASCSFSVMDTIDGFQYFALVGKDDVKRALDFWMNLADETSRDIKLRLCFHHKGIFATHRALMELGFAVGTQLRELYWAQRASRRSMLLRGRHGTVRLSVRDGR